MTKTFREHPHDKGKCSSRPSLIVQVIMMMMVMMIVRMVMVMMMVEEEEEEDDEDDALSPFFDCAREVIPDSAIKQICSHLKIIEGKLFEESKQMLCGIKIDPENIFRTQ